MVSGIQESNKTSMKFSIITISFLIVLFACKPAKKIQKVAEVTSTSDTIKVFADKRIELKDTAVTGKNIYNKVISSKINFTTFSAKAKIAYSSKEENQDATVYIRIKNDSAIWLSLRGPLGIEGFRVLITKDSVKVMNLLKKNVQYTNIGFLQQFTGIPFDFSALQDLIIGNPVFTDSNVLSYTTQNNNQLQLLMQGFIFKHLFTGDITNYKVLRSTLNDPDVKTNRTCDIFYNDYENSDGNLFSTKRRIFVESTQLNCNINLDFKQNNFNQPVTFPFNIPRNYKRL